MGFLKKRKTYTSADSQNLYDQAEYEESARKARKVAVKQYIEDVDGRFAWEHNINLIDYVTNSERTFVSGWDKALKLSQSEKYRRQLYRYNTQRTNYYQGEYYPFITLKGYDIEGGNRDFREANIALCNTLNMNWSELRNQFVNAYGGEWGNIKHCFVGLGIELPENHTVDRISHGKEKSNVTYAFLYYKHLIEQRYGMRSVIGNPATVLGPFCEVSDEFYTVQQNFISSSITYHTYPSLQGYGDWNIQQGDYWLHHDKVNDSYIEHYRKCGWEEREVGEDKIRREWKCRDETRRVYRYYHNVILNHLDTHGIHHRIVVPISHFRATSEDGEIHYDGQGLPYLVQVVLKQWKDGDHPDDWLTITTYPSDDADAWVTPKHGYALNKNTVSDLLVLPVDRKLLQSFNTKEKAKLLRENFYVYHIWQKTIKVYKGWVKPLVKLGAAIAAVAITIKSVGTGSSAAAALLKAAGTVAVGFAIDKLVDFAVKLGIISAKSAAVFKAVIAIAMIAHGAGWDFSKILTAPNIMSAMNHSFNAYNKQKAFEIAETYKQIQDETVKYQTKMEELRAKQKMVDLGTPEDAYIYLNMPSYAPKVNLFETPEMMYARHDNINIVNISLGIVNNLSTGLLSKQQTPKLETVRDIQQEVEDVLLIT